MIHHDACSPAVGGVFSTLPDDPIFTCTLVPEDVAQSDFSWDGVREENQSRRIMIVDDEPFNIKLIRKQLEAAGYRDFVTATDPTDVLTLVRQHHPDVLLLDIVMPGLSGLTLLKQIRGDAATSHLPVIMVTAANDAGTKTQALEAGATDLLDKPLDPTQLGLRVRNALVIKAQFDRLRDWAVDLEREVRRRTAELEVSRLELIQCLGRAGEFRDNETGRHVVRVSRYVGIIARSLGLDEKTAQLIAETSTLHDMGKIGLPDQILLKPGALTPTETQLMREHAVIGGETLSNAADQTPRIAQHTDIGNQILSTGRSPLLRMAASIAYSHHEKWDGTGYPLGLRGAAIPLAARITAVADVFDALSCDRPYKKAIPPDECFAMMRRERGKHFDPAVLDAFLAREAEVLAIYREYGEFERDEHERTSGGSFV